MAKYQQKVKILDPPELRRRYDKTQVVKLDGDGVYEIKKPPFEKISTTAFMWDEPDDKKDRTYYDLESKFDTLRYLTLHTYMYYGFFKPDLAETLSQLPQNLFDDYSKIFLSVTMFIDGDKRAIFENHHLGITNVIIRDEDKI